MYCKKFENFHLLLNFNAHICFGKLTSFVMLVVHQNNKIFCLYYPVLNASLLPFLLLLLLLDFNFYDKVVF